MIDIDTTFMENWICSCYSIQQCSKVSTLHGTPLADSVGPVNIYEIRRFVAIISLIPSIELGDIISLPLTPQRFNPVEISVAVREDFEIYVPRIEIAEIHHSELSTRCFIYISLL